MENLWKIQKMSLVKSSVSSFKVSYLKTLQLQINCCCLGRQRSHVNCTWKLSPTSLDVSGNRNTSSSSTGSSTRNYSKGLEFASWTFVFCNSICIEFYFILSLMTLRRTEHLSFAKLKGMHRPQLNTKTKQNSIW